MYQIQNEKGLSILYSFNLIEIIQSIRVPFKLSRIASSSISWAPRDLSKRVITSIWSTKSCSLNFIAVFASEKLCLSYKRDD